MFGQKIKKVAVLMGGISSEREISFLSGNGVMQALKKLGYQTQAIDVTDDLAKWIKSLIDFKPDVVFNALHGRFGEDGGVQGILNALKIPYTHSGVMASSMGMDKQMTRLIATQIGIPVAKGGLKTKSEFEKMKLPLVVKPNAEGSSCGVQIVQTEKDKKQALQNWPENQKQLVEKYIEGRELSVAVLDGKALGSVELCVKKGWYDYQNKYAEGAVEHLIPAPVSIEQRKKLHQYAEKIHQFLNCRGVSRSDFRLSPTGRIYFLEINTNPGMTPTSLVPDMARLKNLTYEDIVNQLVQGAKCD
jgi:D-alanine-D-alanine ligase